MKRRGLLLSKILLLSLFMGACSSGEDPSQNLGENVEFPSSSKEKVTEEASDKREDMYEDMELDIITENNHMNIDEVEESIEDMHRAMMKDHEMKFKDYEVEESIEDMQETANTDNDSDDLFDAQLIRDKLRGYPAGTVIDLTDMEQEFIDSLFIVEELSPEIINRIAGKSYKEDADIPHSDLRYIRVLHTGFDGETHIGEMIVNKAIAEDVVDIFYDLYKISYPIEKMLLIDEYDADDMKSMEDNNSSSFNFRVVDGTTRRSVHSDGLAIDINPLYNPYVSTRNGKTEVLPESGLEYTDRDKENIYYIRKDDPCYQAFISRGFTWGGEWRNSKDYQHFEKKMVD